ncbi:MAG: PAS domain-containing protein [Planctomycetaceae bacterium]
MTTPSPESAPEPSDDPQLHDQALLETLLNSIPDAIYFKDEASRFLRISESMARMFGLKSAADAVGMTDRDFFTEEHASETRADELRIMRTGEPLVGRVERETWPDRPVTWASSTKLPLRDSAGNIVGTFGLSRDITDLIRIEEELERERDRLRTLTNHLPDVIFIKDRQGRFLLTNPALTRLYGQRSPRQLEGRTDFDFVPAEVARHFQEDDQRVMASGQPLIDREESNVDATGETLWMLTSKIPLRDADGNVIGLVGIGRDITRLKRAQQHAARKAVEAELLYQATSLARDSSSLQEALQGCLELVCDKTEWEVGHVFRPADPPNENFLTSMQLWYPEVDPQMQYFRSLTESHLLPRGKGLAGAVWVSAEPGWIPNVPDVFDRQSAEIFRQAGLISGVAFPVVIQGETVAVLEFFARTEQPVDVALLSVFQSVGEQVGRVIERKRNEEAIRKALEAADAANRAKSDFLANVSHEIRTPMNGVLGMTELLLETELTSQQREYLLMVQSSGESLLDLINDILDFSKIESGKLDLEAIPFSLHESLGDTMKLLGTRAHRQGLELAYSIHESIPEFLIGDPARLRQVVVNLVGNAIAFTERGEVVLRATCWTDATIVFACRCRCRTPNRNCGRQTGRHFDAFHRADTSTTRTYGGTGLDSASPRGWCR